MSNNSLYHLLKTLCTLDDITGWVSATVLTKHRSSYRKPGAMMLVSPLGQTFGLISGGCLESDIVMRARRVLEYGKADYVVYDSTEDGNIAAELGLGCNGRIGVLVEELTDKHQQLYQALLERMEAGKHSALVYCYADTEASGLLALVDQQGGFEFCLETDQLPEASLSFEGLAKPLSMPIEDMGDSGESGPWVVTQVKPPVRLLVVGGGVDSQPVAELAVKLGWRVSVADHRTVNARLQNFPGVEAMIQARPGDLADLLQVDAVIVMSHNLDTDAQWISYCQKLTKLGYLGLLGPVSRKDEVLFLAGIDKGGAFAAGIHGPMGLDIGGDLPESVAISVIAECHQVLAAKSLL